MNKIAFIYPGQGAQKAGMGSDFYEQSSTAKAIFDAASDKLNMDMKALCFEKNEQLDITEYTQPAMVTTCLAMTAVLKERGLKPDVTAGLSLGEYCAIAAAGAMTDIDAIKTVRERGILMQNAVPAGIGAMAAIVGLDGSEIEAVLSGMPDVYIANYNCPGQIVITGRKEAVEQAGEELKEAGARRVIMLNVSGPFHSPLLKEAGGKLLEVLERVNLDVLEVPYVSNVQANYVNEYDMIKQLLALQVCSPVKWQQSMERLIADGVDTFVEIGPGRTLAGFLKKINSDVKVYNIGTWEDVDKVVGELQC